MIFSGLRTRRLQHGLALVAVMWMVAALAILVTGMTSGARTEVRAAQSVRALAVAGALGDAAIQLTLLEMRSKGDPMTALSRLSYQVEGREIAVIVTPDAGLVNINSALPPLLKALFEHGAGRSSADAELLAQRVVAWRSGDSALVEQYDMGDGGFRPRGAAFEFTEDLLQVQGVTFDDYDRIRRLITVMGGTSGVDPLAAPLEVLMLLTDGDQGLAHQIDDMRFAKDPLVDFTALDQGLLGVAGTSSFRVDAIVPVDARTYRRTRWISFEYLDPGGGPWMTVRVEAPTGFGGEIETEDGS